MWKLLVRYGEAGEADFPLVGPMEVGRDPECQLWFDEPQVSRRHARFFLVEQSAYIQDLDSANGVLQNGERIQDQSELRPGDILVIGGHKMLVTWSSEGPVPPPRDDTARGQTVHADSAAELEKRDIVKPEPEPKPTTPEPSAKPEVEAVAEAVDAPPEDFPPEHRKAKGSGCFTVLAVAVVVIIVVAWSV